MVGTDASVCLDLRIDAFLGLARLCVSETEVLKEVHDALDVYVLKAANVLMQARELYVYEMIPRTTSKLLA